jgi:glucose/arabinose dehydrogenase
MPSDLLARRHRPLGMSVAQRFAGLFSILVLTAACDDDEAVGPFDAGLDAGRDAATVDAAVVDAAPDAFAIAVARPERRDFSEARLQQLRVPSGFRVNVFAAGLGNPRMMATGPDGSVYVTVREQSQVLRLTDSNGDGDASDPGEQLVVASKTDSPDLDGVHGITVHMGKVYLASTKAVLSASLSAGAFTGLQTLLRDLPDGGQHPNRTLAVGPDGKLYVTVGSSCNACPETNPEHATMLRLELTGAAAQNPANPQHPMLARNPMSMMSARVFASGLRNTIGFDWHPATNELWGSEHGSDGLGDDIPPDEINRVEGGKSYGWPWCWGNRQVDPAPEQPSRTLTREQYCATTEPPRAAYPAHSAPIGFLFYRGGQFPAEYQGDAFVAFRGSWNRSRPTGYMVARVRFANGQPVTTNESAVIQEFLSGFLIEGGAAHFGRLAGLTVDATGALLVAEDTNGVIYRVSYPAGAVDAGARD